MSSAAAGGIYASIATSAYQVQTPVTTRLELTGTQTVYFKRIMTARSMAAVARIRTLLGSTLPSQDMGIRLRTTITMTRTLRTSGFIGRTAIQLMEISRKGSTIITSKRAFRKSAYIVLALSAVVAAVSVWGGIGAPIQTVDAQTASRTIPTEAAKLGARLPANNVQRSALKDGTVTVDEVHKATIDTNLCIQARAKALGYSVTIGDLYFDSSGTPQQSLGIAPAADFKPTKDSEEQLDRSSDACRAEILIVVQVAWSGNSLFDSEGRNAVAEFLSAHGVPLAP
ncbi:hypothetical protein IMCC26256_111454 [Actinobacteria bacterium IMCC26256]|nr:hypothetical protein IMCC26256_111454 [Actinobacteria bacterium IMCC26256]